MKPSRRALLQGIGATGALAALGLPSEGNAATGVLGEKPYKILEICLLGAMSHRDTLWTWSSGGASYCGPVAAGVSTRDGCRWGDTVDSWSRVAWRDEPTGPIAYGVSRDQLPTSSDTKQIGEAATSPVLDALVKGGGLSRASLIDYVRVLAMRHDWPALPPHEAAQPHMLTGSRLGRTGFAGQAAAVMHRWRDASGAVPLGTAVVLHAPVGAPTIEQACATGPFGDGYRPPSVMIPDGSLIPRLGTLASQNNTRSALDNWYVDRYRSRLAGVRSNAFAGYEAAFDYADAAADVQSLFAGIDLGSTSDSQPTRCDKTIRAAVQLLKGDTTKYVCMLETGAFGGFDMHGTNTLTTISDPWEYHARIHNFNLWWVLAKLQENLTPTDLADILVVIHTEFGRTSWTELSGHWTQAYGALLLGGPIGTAQKGSVGRVLDSTSAAQDAITPVDLRAALHLAANIDPYAEPAALPLFRTVDHLAHDHATYSSQPASSGRSLSALHSLGLTSSQLGDATLPSAELKPALCNTVFGRS